jgi:hypothetical protein
MHVLPISPSYLGDGVNQDLALGTETGHTPRKIPSSLWIWTALAGLVLGLFCIVIYVPGWLYPELDSHTQKQFGLTGQQSISEQDERLALQNNARTALVQFIAGVAVLSGATVAWRQLRHSITDTRIQRNSERQSLTLDQYSRAMQGIGDDNIGVRLGGIYLLVMLAQKEPTYRRAACQVLNSFVSSRSPWPPSEKSPLLGASLSSLTEMTVRSPDVQSAVTAIVLNANQWQHPEIIRLSRCDLRRTNLTGGNLDMADLTDSHLEGSTLSSARFARATLCRANFVGADLSDADLTDSDIRGTIFSEANITGMRLTNAIFDETTVWPRGVEIVEVEKMGARKHQ